MGRVAAAKGIKADSPRTIALASDLEGPWSKGDLALQLLINHVPNGRAIFTALGTYNIYRMHAGRAEPGDTLNLIVPILIAHNVTESDFYTATKECATFLSGAKVSASFLMQQARPFLLITTTYSQYAFAVASQLDVPRERVRSTAFPIDELKRHVREDDKQKVVELSQKIAEMGKHIVGALSESPSPQAIKAVGELDNIYGTVLPRTSFTSLLEGVVPVGGKRKLEVLQKELANYSTRRVAAVGDSITDIDMLSEVKKGGGLSVSFNGNSDAIKCANVAVFSYSCVIMPVLAQLFERTGIEGVERVTSDWSMESLRYQRDRRHLDKWLVDSISSLRREGHFPVATWITDGNIERLTRLSAQFRNDVRGEVVGSLR